MTDSQYAECAEACMDCAIACNRCAIACLQETDVGHLVQCIRLDLECMTICRAAADMLTMNSSQAIEICRLCVNACNACADECDKHAAKGMEHCRVCAAACRECAKACSWMLSGKVTVAEDIMSD